MERQRQSEYAASPGEWYSSRWSLRREANTFDTLTITVSCRMNTKRLKVSLRAEADAAYDTAYHNKLRGRVGTALAGTEYERDGNGDASPLGLSYSSLLPWGDLTEGDTRYVIFAASREDVLIKLAADFKRNPKFNIGEMPLRVTGLEEHTADVGPPGTTGRLETKTGVLVKFAPVECNEYGIDSDGDTVVFWRQADHSISAFADKLESTLQTRWEQLDSAPNGPGPTDLYEPLFSEYNFKKDFAVPLTVTEDETRTLILSKWELGYTVQSPAHRDVLNFVLATGLSARSNYGLGFTEITTKDTPEGQTAPHPPIASETPN